jgi:hypothetical protein
MMMMIACRDTLGFIQTCSQLQWQSMSQKTGLPCHYSHAPSKCAILDPEVIAFILRVRIALQANSVQRFPFSVFMHFVSLRLVRLL